MTDCPKPVGIHEIAERHGTTPGTIRSWRNRHTHDPWHEGDFPRPIVRLAMGPVFNVAEVDEWMKTRYKRGRT